MENSAHLTDSREREKVINDFTTTFWVEAGAGTGKTSLLINRLLNIIIREKVHLDEIVAITFTEKAAGEIKERLRTGLEAGSRKSSAREKTVISRALEEIEYAPLLTIHSFAASLLRERPVEAGVDPRFIILDAEDADTLYTKVWEDWFREELDHYSEYLQRAVKFGFNETQLKDLALLLYEHRDIVQEGSAAPCPEFSAKRFLDEMQKYCSDLIQLRETCRDKTDSGYLQIQDFNKWLKSVSNKEEDDLLKSVVNRMPDIKGRGNKKNWSPGENCTLQKDICKNIQDAREEVMKLTGASVLSDIITWLRGFLKTVEKKKRENSALDFNDLLLKARNLLKDDKETRGYFQKRFRYLLVDEFQDTDPLQAEIIFFLGEKEPRAAEWNKVEISPGKLFLVGDPKQAIYRFRRADIEIYEEAKQVVEKQGELLKIVQNFRTVPSVINWVNSSFPELIKPVPGKPYQPEYTELHPFRQQPEHNPKSVIVLSFPEGMEEKKAEEKREEEAYRVASFINGAVGRQMVCAENGQSRPLSWEDIGILFPTTTGLDIYQQVLQDKGVPYRLEGGKMFFRRQEVNSFVSLLTAVDNPYDTVSLVSALRNYFGISDEEILLFKESGYSIDFLKYNDLPVESGLIRQAFTVMSRMHEYRKTASLPRFLGRLLQETGTYSSMLLGQRGEQVVSNLEKIIELSRSPEQSGVFTLQQFIRWLEEKGERGREESESVLSERDRRAVQLLTVHRSKGLEFNMVILVNLLSGSSTGREKFVSDRLKRQFELKAGPFGFSTFGFEEIKKEEELRLEAEKRRLFYVAATRARDYLVIPLIRDKKDAGFIGYLKTIEKNGGISPEKCYFTEPDPETDYPAGEGRHYEQLTGTSGEREKVDVDPPDLMKKSSLRQEELQKTVARGKTPSRTINAGNLVEYEYNDKAADTPGGSDYSLPRGAGFGSAFHQVMERINLQAPSAEDTDYHIKDAAAYWGLDSAAEEELNRLVERTRDNPLIKRALGSSIYREVPFAVKVHDCILEGLVDLLFEEPEGLVIVDYKTDNVRGSKLEERFNIYRLQGLFYAFALHKATGRNISEVNFFFVRPGRVMKIENPSFSEVKEKIRLYGK